MKSEPEKKPEPIPAPPLLGKKLSFRSPSPETPETIGIGLRLRTAREAKAASLIDAEKATRIRREYLEALEKEEFKRLPEGVFIKGFLQSYARYLGLPPDEIVAAYRQVYEPEPIITVVPAARPLRTPSSWLPGLLLGLALFALLVGGLLYMANQPGTRPTPVPTPVLETPPPPTLTPTRVPTPTPLSEVVVPDLIGQDVTRAEALLKAAGLALGAIAYRSEANTPAGRVLAQSHAPGTRTKAGSFIAITVSKASEGVVLPNVINTPFSEAQKRLTDAGFRVQRRDQPSSKVAAELVIDQNPLPGVSLTPGTTITLWVSVGNKVVVPNLVGQHRETALRMIKEAGLTPTGETCQEFTDVPVNHILSQMPAAGTLVDAGTIVRVNVRCR